MYDLIDLFVFYRNWISTNVSISNGTWEHITVVLQKRHPVVSIYVNKKLKYTPQSSLSITDSELSSSAGDITLKLNSDIETGAHGFIVLF